MATELTTEKPTSVVPADNSAQVFSLLQTAVAQGTSPEALERLVALQERIMDRDAESKFVTAMTEFQARCPAVEKRKTVKDRGGKKMYAYAPLADIVTTVRPLLHEMGLSYSFDTEEKEGGGVVVSCIVRHMAGHKEVTRLTIPATKGMNTNASQNRGIQLQYGERYAFTGAFGIVTADEDTDAASQQLRPISDGQAADLDAMIDEVGADRARFLAYLGVSDVANIPASDYGRAVAALESKRSRG